MVRQNKGLIAIIAILSVTVFAMSIGFAASTYNQDLKLNSGVVTVKKSKWDVHFKTDSYAEAANSVTATAHTVSDTVVTFTATLVKPGSFYEFNVDIENGGTFDADLSKITMSSLTEAQAKYLTYSITYDGKTYTETSNVTGSQLKADGTGTDTKTATIRVEYIEPADAADLPTADVDVTLTATFSFVQAAE